MILAYHGTGLIGAAIRRQTRGKYSHVAWCGMNGDVIEAWHIGGVLHSDNPFVLHGLDAKFDVYSVRCLTGIQTLHTWQFLLSQVGKGYDFAGIVRFLSGVNRNNWDRWFCSELVAEALENAGRPMLQTEAWRLSPVTLCWSNELTLAAQNVGIEWWTETFQRLLKA